MKVLHVLSQMPDFTGSGKTVQAIIRQSCASGHENFLVAGIQDDFKSDPSLLPPDHTEFVRFNHGGLNFRLPGMSDVMPYPSTVFSLMDKDQICRYETAFRKALQRAREKFRPDLIHTHHLWIVSKTARQIFSDLPMATSCHGTCLRQYFLCPGLDRELGNTLKDIDAVFCLSRHQRQQIRDIHKIAAQKLHIVGAGFEKKIFYPGRKPEKGPVEIVYAGKLSRSKGVPWLLAALKKVSAPNYRLHLAGTGTGPEKQECLALAADLKGRVKVHGPLPHESLARLMRSAHLFVLPSFFEGLPLVLMEALSCGCRVLTTALPGTREIFEDTLSHDMVRLLELPALETVDTPFQRDMPVLEQALAHALEVSITKADKNRQPDLPQINALTGSYTWESVFSKMEKIYQTVCNPG
ncbi:glycosyltransferase family 4 protein [uncultured Desulfobacter sp.]|uniref:glycosyltransferase family 4 protein n=1 Tax=uncultured Desulfobacter sp. TaxID=240139 RepID=UPI002AAAF11A|nr:glycosyltransferase family 4 protein [uncultured Desulfobacter sp.]